ncbi:MAG: sodium:solute symporter [Candidatus Eisenbacteria bacterium RBG_16_71_46]|nr:MAG: sodium:solute symporter [Candidatus Eisenbacteria bacterium RBG_16_71_46]
MSALDWTVLFGALAFFVLYGLWRSRGERNLTDYLLAGRSMPWTAVALSVMATQASAITFMSTPGQGYADGLRFVQFYFGLPLAMIVICATAIPIYQRLKVFTAYEYLQRRFDGKTRSLASALFLIQRGLATGLTIYAPALVLSVILGWDLRLTCVLLGGLVVIYTATGGSKAVSHTHVLQFLIIIATMIVAFGIVVSSFPAGVGLGDAARAAGALGRFNAIDLRFDPNSRYTLWSGLIGGFFLQLSYFGTDQSQVGRYLTGRSIAQSRLGLLFNGAAKVPMQFGILYLGMMVFVFYLFVCPPLFFNPAETAKMANGAGAAEYQALEARQREAFEARQRGVRAMLEAERAGDRPAAEAAARAAAAEQARLDRVRVETGDLLRRVDPGASTNDTNYVFLRFVLAHLPVGLIGLVFAAIFAASMNSIAAELNALTSTTVVDVLKRLRPGSWTDRADLVTSRVVTLFWAAFAVAFAEYASRLGTLVEAVNILGSLFYGTILGIFLTAFYVKRVGGTAVFVAALLAEAAVIACFKLTAIGFLWYNLIGCVLVLAFAWALSPVWPRTAEEAA